MKFLADHMLGSLARWLRFFGFDTVYPDVLDDKKLKECAKRENRFLLTRDKDLANARGIEVLYIKSIELEEQLVQVLSEYNLKIESALSRCSLCNNVLISVEKSEVSGKVPERVYEVHNEFLKCEKCSKFYWEGTHFQKIKKKIKELEGKTP
jgi:uncharacterized protein with PIN domain